MHKIKSKMNILIIIIATTTILINFQQEMVEVVAIIIKNTSFSLIKIS